MTVLQFPPINLADEHGLLAIGGDLEVDSLKLAYSQGIFPWPFSDRYPLSWYTPDPRGIIDFKDVHVPKSLHKFLKKNPYTVRFNSRFPEVIKACAHSQHRKGPQGETSTSGTWITPKMIKAYTDFFRAGYAFSVEVFSGDQLAGGLYGVIIDRFVSGESMFYLKPNASKVALLALIERLKGKNIHWMDTQMVTPIITVLGGKEIPRGEYMDRLKDVIHGGQPMNHLLTY